MCVILSECHIRRDYCRLLQFKDACDVSLQVAAVQHHLFRPPSSSQVQFSRLRSICVAAEQGLRSMLQRLMIALEEIVPAALPSAAQTLRSPSGVQAAVPGENWPDMFTSCVTWH